MPPPLSFPYCQLKAQTYPSQVFLAAGKTIGQLVEEGVEKFGSDHFNLAIIFIPATLVIMMIKRIKHCGHCHHY